MNIDEQIRSFEKRFDLETLIEDYYKPDNSSSQRRRLRDQIIGARMVLIDLQFAKFVEEFSGNRKDFETGADLTVLGLNTAGALFTPAGTVRVLSGVAGAATGTRLAVDKNYFYEKTIPVLINAMNAQRATIRARIEESIAKEDSAYSLPQAWSDTADYYLAGTFDGALQGIQANSGEQKREAEKRIDSARVFQTNANPEATKLRRYMLGYFMSLPVDQRPAFNQELSRLAKEIYHFEGKATGFVQSASFEQLDLVRRLMKISEPPREPELVPTPANGGSPASQPQ